MKSKLTTLCYLERDGKYLMLHRVSKEKDVNKDKWIGVGGHFEEGESPEDCLLREVKEETGLTLTSFQFRGIVTFLCEGWQTEYMCLYTADGFEGTMTECDEGVLEWVDKEKIEGLNLWDGDKLFFHLLDRGEPFFSLKLCYRADGTWYSAQLNGRELELFDICDENGVPSGRIKERAMVHRDGDLHRTVHMWVIRKKEDGRFDVLLQKRSRNKDAYPGCYDISSAGHVRAGDDYDSSALRELDEELGIRAEKGDLRFIGYHIGDLRAEFWGSPFLDKEVSAVYLYEKPVKESELKLQKSEVEEAVFMDYDTVLAKIRDGSLKNCIFPGEFAMLREALKPGYSPDDIKVSEKFHF